MSRTASRSNLSRPFSLSFVYRLVEPDIEREKGLSRLAQGPLLFFLTFPALSTLISPSIFSFPHLSGVVAAIAQVRAEPPDDHADHAQPRKFDLEVHSAEEQGPGQARPARPAQHLFLRETRRRELNNPGSGALIGFPAKRHFLAKSPRTAFASGLSLRETVTFRKLTPFRRWLARLEAGSALFTTTESIKIPSALLPRRGIRYSTPSFSPLAPLPPPPRPSRSPPPPRSEEASPCKTTSQQIFLSARRRLRPRAPRSSWRTKRGAGRSRWRCEN